MIIMGDVNVWNSLKTAASVVQYSTISYRISADPADNLVHRQPESKSPELENGTKGPKR